MGTHFVEVAIRESRNMSTMLLAIANGASALTLSPKVTNVGVTRTSELRMAETVSLDQTVLDRYMALPSPDKVQAEYLWIDADGEVRSKCRTVDASKVALDKLPYWNYDGSSTGQAPGDDSEVIIRPRAIYKDPFRGGDNILVLTDTYTPAGEALPTNSRKEAEEIFSATTAEIPWFGLEQEYTLFNMDRVLTTALRVLIAHMAVLFRRRIIRHACSLASKSLEPTPRGCQASGSIRSVHVLVSRPGTK